MLAAQPGRPAAAAALPVEAGATVTPAAELLLAAQRQAAINSRSVGLRQVRPGQVMPLISSAAQAPTSTTATPACLPDAQEPNDNLTLCPAGDVDYFALNTQPGQHY